jgi:hypothetical protein
MQSRGRRHAGIASLIAVAVLAVAACSSGGGDDEGSGDDDADQQEQASTAERAPSGFAQVIMTGDVDVELEPLSGAMGTETVFVSLSGRAEVPELGRGRAARQPAEGETFVVVALAKRTVDAGGAVTNIEQTEMEQRGTATLSVQVGDEEPRAIELDTPSYTPLPLDLDDPPQPPAAEPGAPVERLVVLSVPEDTDQLDLVVSSPDLEQRLSLVTGEPGPDNVAVLARGNRTMTPVPPAQPVTATQTEFGMSGGSSTQTVGVQGASLQWSTGSGETRQTAGPGRAILTVVMDTSGINYGLASELRLADGSVVQPMPASDEMLASMTPAVYFDVPADFTEGTLVFGKDYTWQVPTGGSMSFDFAGTVEYPIAITADA